MQHICVFEDHQYVQLVPLVYTKGVFELRCGLFTSLERIFRHYSNAGITLFCRDYLSHVLRERYPYHVNTLPAEGDVCLFLNGRMVLPAPIPVQGREELGVQNNTIVYARLKRENIGKIFPEIFLTKSMIELFKSAIPIVHIQIPVINYFWDIINLNKSLIEKDFLLSMRDIPVSEKLYEGVYRINKDRIFIGKETHIKPCCVLDAENGPIYIGDHVTIAANTTIEGPVYIGNHVTIHPNARLRGGTNIGEFCKVGGEIANTIFHSYSNKQHDGFLGDSYIGSWVNMGAGTVNSNLLNTYGNVKVKIGSDILDTGQIFLGMAMGDNTKTAINTTIMTGSVFGFGCNIITPVYPPKYLPSFTWCLSHGILACTLEKSLRMAKIAMKRRNKEMSESEERLFRTVFQLTEHERCIS